MALLNPGMISPNLERIIKGFNPRFIPHLCNANSICGLKKVGRSHSRKIMIKMAEDVSNYPSDFSNAAFDIVAIAASAGGLNALAKVLSTLPTEFTAAIAIVQHLGPKYRSLMAEILARRTHLTVKQAQEGDRLTPGTAYIAPPNRHLLVNRDGTLSLSQSELVHFLRPSANLLFESVAVIYKDRAIAVVLTGTGSDGAIGVEAIKKMGGTVIAQSVETAEFSGMPSAAIQTGNVDFILPLNEISRVLVTLVMGESY